MIDYTETYDPDTLNFNSNLDFFLFGVFVTIMVAVLINHYVPLRNDK
tara:strand:+ start:774 stop:914 length:141 start_codon:yes stop_codon:yes gene_type:complete